MPLLLFMTLLGGGTRKPAGEASRSLGCRRAGRLCGDAPAGAVWALFSNTGYDVTQRADRFHCSEKRPEPEHVEVT